MPGSDRFESRHDQPLRPLSPASQHGVPATWQLAHGREVLVATPAVRNLIREGRMAQLCSVMQAGAAEGMLTMEGAMKQLKSEGLIELG